jgi:hypothetical protein
MKKLSLYLLLTFTPYTFLAQGKGKIKVHVTFTNSYCGGARPTPEIEQATRTPRNLHDVHLIMKGKKHAKIVTDSLGNFFLPLKPGKYKFYMSYHKNDAHETNYEPTCKKMMALHFGELTVVKGTFDYELNLHFPCDPCGLPRP